jgi:tRNA U34 5-carboxymethylaminomethyl modifying enzyme MnmG/GidA
MRNAQHCCTIAAMVIFAIGTYAVNSIILGWVSNTCGQTNEKKASSLAIVNTIANISFIWTPVSSLPGICELWLPVCVC